MSCPHPSSSPPSSGMPCPTPPSPSSSSKITQTDLEALFDLLNHLANAHQQLRLLQGWLGAHAELIDFIDNDWLSEDQVKRLLRVMSKLNDNFVLIITRIQGCAVYDGCVPTGYWLSALHRVTNYSEQEIEAVREMLANIHPDTYGYDDVETTYRTSKRILKEILEVLIQACRNVDLYAYVISSPPPPLPQSQRRPMSGVRCIRTNINSNYSERTKRSPTAVSW